MTTNHIFYKSRHIVIASVAWQSPLDCFVASLLAMTGRVSLLEMTSVETLRYARSDGGVKVPESLKNPLPT